MDLPVTEPSDPNDVSFQTGVSSESGFGTDPTLEAAPVVPEPGSFLMLALGGGIAFLRRRMKGKKAESNETTQD